MTVEGAQYEFTAAQNAVVTDLARKMRSTAIAKGVFGVALWAVAAILFRRSVAIELLLVALGGKMLLLAWSLTRSSSHFSRIATSEGHDIDNLIVAINALGDAYASQTAVAIAFGIVLVLLAASVR